MSRSYKKRGVLKVTRSKGKQLSNRAFRRRNRQRLHSGQEDLLDRNAIFNRYDIVDQVYYYSERRLQRLNEVRRTWWKKEEITLDEWKRIYFNK